MSTPISEGPEPPSTDQPAALSHRKPAGPRTLPGKQRSRYNAVKHAIFTAGVVWERESEREYCALVTELIRTLQPIGKLEEVLVEKLAMLVWRYRRLLQAEAAEVGRSMHAIENKEAGAMLASYGHDGLVRHALISRDEFALRSIVDCLRQLRDTIRQGNLDWERDRDALTLLYGKDVESECQAEFLNKYRETVSGAPDGQDGSEEVGSRQLILELLEKELTKRENLLRLWGARCSRRNELRRTVALVPQEEVVERLQHYEASLERCFDRTLSQLERLQRMRLGQPVAPPIKVNFSA